MSGPNTILVSSCTIPKSILNGVPVPGSDHPLFYSMTSNSISIGQGEDIQTANKAICTMQYDT